MTQIQNDSLATRKTLVGLRSPTTILNQVLDAQKRIQMGKGPILIPNLGIKVAPKILKARATYRN